MHWYRRVIRSANCLQLAEPGFEPMPLRNFVPPAPWSSAQKLMEVTQVKPEPDCFCVPIQYMENFLLTIFENMRWNHAEASSYDISWSDLFLELVYKTLSYFWRDSAIATGRPGATLGRWGRRGDCQVDDGLPVVVNSTTIGAAHGALRVATGAYSSNWFLTLSIPPALLCIHALICHCIISYMF